MRAQPRPWMIALVSLLAMAIAVVCMGDPGPAVAPAPVAVIAIPPMPAPAPVAFPEDVPPGAMWNGRKKPIPGEVPPPPPTEAELDAWRADLAREFGEANAACGVPPLEVTCAGPACGVVAEYGVHERILYALRRPRMVLERFAVGTLGLPPELDRCDAEYRDLAGRGFTLARAGDRCFMFTFDRRPEHFAAVDALCDALIR